MPLTEVVGTKPTDFGIGLIAQEGKKGFPEAVMTDQNGYLRIDPEILQDRISLCAGSSRVLVGIDRAGAPRFWKHD